MQYGFILSFFQLTDNTVAMVMYCRKGLTQTILLTYLILGLYFGSRAAEIFYVRRGEVWGGILK